MRTYAFLAIASLFRCLLLGSEAESARQFEAHVAPMLARHCFECHDSSTREGKLDLSRKETALKDRKNGPLIVPGKSSESLLWKVIESNEMPEDRPPLSDEEKKHLRAWIDSGAVWAAEQIDPLAYIRDTRAAYNWVRRLTVPEYIETVRSAVGVQIVEEARRFLPRDVRADGFANTAYNLTADLQHVEAYAKLAEIIVNKMDVPKYAAQFSKCKELDDACMRQLISEMGKWLFRGPLSEHEIKPFLDLSKAVRVAEGNFDEAARYVLEAMLQSPRFIYRMENQHGDGEKRPAAPHEVASRLSYILWGAPPDKELVRAADAGELSDGKNLQKQIDRMLQDQRAIDRSARFMHEWLDLDRLSNLRPNPKHFPTWHDELASDMRAETLAFFEEIAWKENRPLSDLINARVTFATPRLASFYGIPPAPSRKPKTEAPERVSQGLQALYTFEEGGGDLIRDLSGAGEPLHLKIEKPAAVRWGRNGLALTSAAMIATDGPAKRLIGALKKAKAVTIEAWITPKDNRQNGPARIISLSSGASARNFTLGQDGDKYDVRFRTKDTGANGQPSLPSPSGVVRTQPTHLVYTRNSEGIAKLYIDGEEKASAEIKGDLSNWDAKFGLLIGNESTGDRPWGGVFHLAAIYDRDLSPSEARQNYSAGTPQKREPELAGASLGERGLRNLQVLYRFDEGEGKTVADSSGNSEPLNLQIENLDAVEWSAEGLTLKKATLLAHDGSAKRLVAALKKAGAVTLEAWITPANSSQKGPARILSLSSGGSQRNFTLGQDGNKYDVRLRTASTDANGMPGLPSQGSTARRVMTHVVYTRDPEGKTRIYINGEEDNLRDIKGDLSSWDDGLRLVVGNETSGDRPWLGTLHLLAIYDRALTSEEIRATGNGIRRYDLASVPGRGGLLTQGSLLTIGGEEASMVARGLFVLQDFLYSAVGNPPPCADTTPVPSKPGLTQRAVAEARIQNKSCGGCHSRFEPLAFSMEKFDGMGAYHETDVFGNKLRDDGEILFPGAEKAIPYKTATEMMDLLAGSERVRKNITRKAIQFSIGRPLVESDAGTIDRIHEAAQKGGGTYASLIRAIASSEYVTMTQTEKQK